MKLNKKVNKQQAYVGFYKNPDSEISLIGYFWAGTRGKAKAKAYKYANAEGLDVDEYIKVLVRRLPKLDRKIPFKDGLDNKVLREVGLAEYDEEDHEWRLHWPPEIIKNW